jgi:hypothetical protein
VWNASWLSPSGKINQQDKFIFINEKSDKQLGVKHMTTVSILPLSDTNGEKFYRAVSGDKQSTGKTAGQALDALTHQLGLSAFEGPLVIQSFRSDPFFSFEQQQRLSELMILWHSARDQGQELLSDQQAALDSLVEAELRAATARTAALMKSEHQ